MLLDHLDVGEDLVPAADVEPRGVVAELPEDLLHLEGGGQGLDQEGGADRPVRDVEGPLEEAEEPVPPPRLEVVLDLGDVVLGGLVLVDQRRGGVEDREREVHQAAGHRLAVDPEVGLGEVEAAAAHHQERHVVRVEAVELLGLAPRAGLTKERVPRAAPMRFNDPLDDVVPGGLHRVLEVEHRGVGAVAGVVAAEHVDHHLGVVDRAGDLDPAARAGPRGRGATCQAPRACLRHLAVEVLRDRPLVPRPLPLGARREQPPALGIELAVEAGDELEGFGHQHLPGLGGPGGAVDLDAAGERRGGIGGCGRRGFGQGGHGGSSGSLGWSSLVGAAAREETP